MKNIKNLLKKISIVLLIIFSINISILFLKETNASSEYENIRLIRENVILKRKYSDIQDRLIEINNKLDSINNANYILYSELLGIDIDSVNIKDIEDEIITSRTFYKIFNKIDDKSLVLSKIASNQINNLLDNDKKSNINKYPNISPIKTIDIIEISSQFGYRQHPIYNTIIYHEGIDISTKYKTKVYSTIDGVVSNVRYSVYGYGNIVTIKNDKYEILYAHLQNNIHVKIGQRIKKGQLISYVGKTGKITGIHLHYEIRKNNKLENPLNYIYTYLTNINNN